MTTSKELAGIDMLRSDKKDTLTENIMFIVSKFPSVRLQSKGHCRLHYWLRSGPGTKHQFCYTYVYKEVFKAVVAGIKSLFLVYTSAISPQTVLATMVCFTSVKDFVRPS